jgi:uncharacterized protein
MNTETVLLEFYQKDSLAYDVLTIHSRLVAQKAVAIARNVPELKPDIRFIEEASMLHDIGMILTHAPGIGCNGPEPYIAHGTMGRKMLEDLAPKYDLSKHALVCERHTGAGLSKNEIESAKLPLPEKDMLPLSIEEIIICFADKFYSKNPKTLEKEKSFDIVLTLLENFGINQKKRFLEWAKLLGYE